MTRKTLPSPLDELFINYAKLAKIGSKLYYLSGITFQYLDLATPNSGWRSIPMPLPTLASPLSMTAVGNKIFYNTGQGYVGAYCPDTGGYLLLSTPF